ncbi:unnamed protein product [Camellia sinensis]
MWRVSAMPIGAHTLLSFLAEPLKQPTETLLSAEDHGVSENLREFQNWRIHVTISDCRILDYLSGHSSYRSVFTVSFQSDGCYMGEEFPLSLVAHDVIKGSRLWNASILNGVWTFVIDGSWRAAEQSAGVACVCFNIDQSRVQDYASRMQLPSPLLAEVKVCW